MIQKPMTVAMDEFKESFIKLINDAELPAWVLIYLIEPVLKELQEIDSNNREQNFTQYMKELEKKRRRIKFSAFFIYQVDTITGLNVTASPSEVLIAIGAPICIVPLISAGENNPIAVPSSFRSIGIIDVARFIA